MDAHEFRGEAMALETQETTVSVVIKKSDAPTYPRVAEPTSMEKPIVVTTSWDDGDRYDLRVAEILRARQIPGTFYIPITPHQQARPALNHCELRSLSSEGFEIGAHGFSHKLLWRLSTEELAKEIGPCRPILEDILGAEVRMFCYPKGRYDANTVRALKQAGYVGARTNRMLATRFAFSPFAMPTTVQISQHTKYAYIKNMARAGTIESLQLCLTHLSRLGDWIELGKRLFDSVLKNGGIWHLYGHSREVEEFGMWEGLEEMLDYVSKREGVTYVHNGDLVRLAASRARCGGNGKL
jgi:peptidoglycan-N-acetylglucosamine deacetylase